ncbi:MAG TPA: hypothetical protein GXX38_02500 [Clostridia bacterium]|jgi:hypothetical protein|nr:hypothetical protein [Clostridia bacterium]
MKPLPCVITYPLDEALSLLKSVSECPIELVHTSPVKKDYIGEEERVIAQRTGNNGEIVLVVAHEQILA